MHSVFKLFLCIGLLGLLISCEDEQIQADREKEAYLKLEAELEAKLGKQWDFISRSQFEELARKGEKVSVEGLAVNAKPLSYLFMEYHVYIISDRNFFWPPRMIGQRMRVSGVPVVKLERENRYAQVDDYRKRYYFQIESWNPVLDEEMMESQEVVVSE